MLFTESLSKTMFHCLECKNRKHTYDSLEFWVQKQTKKQAVGLIFPFTKVNHFHEEKVKMVLICLFNFVKK